MKMTLLELQTTLTEIIAELEANEQHTKSIKEKVMELIKKMGED